MDEQPLEIIARKGVPLMDWIEISIDTTTEGCDLVANVFYEVGAAGVVIEDPEEARAIIREKNGWDYIEPGALNIEGNVVVVKGYLPADEALDKRVDTVKKSLARMPRGHVNLGSLILNSHRVDDENWAESWKEFYKPFKIGENIVIKPSWEDYDPRRGDIVVTIDPGMAFGTGTHESTALCIELLEKWVNTGDRVFDIGCGSGILAIIAAKLGAGSVWAYDLQETAVNITRNNAKLNGVDGVVKAYRGDLLDGARNRANIIVSNIVADAIIRMGPSIPEHLTRDGIFIASGIIRDRKEEVRKALLNNGMETRAELICNEWIALTARLKE